MSSLFVKTRKCPAWAQGELMGRDSVQLAYWYLGRHWAKEHLLEHGCAIYRVGLLRTGVQRWHTWCHHTAHAVCQKFGMTHLTSSTGQCLLAEASADVPQPVLTGAKRSALHYGAIFTVTHRNVSYAINRSSIFFPNWPNFCEVSIGPIDTNCNLIW